MFYLVFQPELPTDKPDKNLGIFSRYTHLMVNFSGLVFEMVNSGYINNISPNYWEKFFWVYDNEITCPQILESRNLPFLFPV
jgi:hypothetical protein